MTDCCVNMTEVLMKKMSLAHLSKRAANAVKCENLMTKYFSVAAANPYDGELNKKGIINLGTAITRVLEEELEKRLQASDLFKFVSKNHQHYTEFDGIPSLKQAVSGFLERNFSDGLSIDPEELVILNGVTACLDSIAFVTCDPGDVMITLTPVYGCVFSDCQFRAHVDVQPLDLVPKTNESEKDFDFRPEMLEDKILELQSQGKTVSAFILLNPSNPLGDIYSLDVVKRLLVICAKFKVHAIFDEIYGLSTFSETPFRSVLSIEELPDPDRTHFLWGMSKDFGLAGLRMGVIHSKNKELISCLAQNAIFQSSPTIVQDAIATLLNDKEWCDNFYVPLNRARLRECHSFARDLLHKVGLKVHNSQAAFFAWVDARPFLKSNTNHEELELFERMLEAGVYVVPGHILYCSTPGWYRLLVTVSKDELTLGVNRMAAVLEAWKNS